MSTENAIQTVAGVNLIEESFMKMISALLVLLSIGSTLLASDFSAQCPEINFAEVTVSSFGNIVKNAASAASFDLILFLSIL